MCKFWWIVGCFFSIYFVCTVTDIQYFSVVIILFAWENNEIKGLAMGFAKNAVDLCFWLGNYMGMCDLEFVNWCYDQQSTCQQLLYLSLFTLSGVPLKNDVCTTTWSLPIGISYHQQNKVVVFLNSIFFSILFQMRQCWIVAFL